MHILRKRLPILALTCALSSGAAWADSISPTSYVGSLAVGDSITIHKTVMVDTATTGSLVDIMFVFDTTGSMGGYINNAKTVATSVLNTIAATYGSTVSGVAQYDDPGSSVLTGLSATATTQTSINSLYACYGSCGGDAPEVGYDGIYDAVTSASWRAGSNRFIVVFGDATFKADTHNATDTLAALTAANVDLFALNFGSGAGLSSVITGLGGTVYAGGTSATTIADAILAGVGAGFANYSTVTVGDLNGGDPLIDVSTVCVSADTGTCVGADAVGDYDRSVSRTFEFDVTFTRLAEGDAGFDTYALVDGAIVATETDRFTDATSVPEPASLALVALSLIGLGSARRKQRD